MADLVAGLIALVVYGIPLLLITIAKYVGRGVWALTCIAWAALMALPIVDKWRAERATARAIAAIRDLTDAASRDMDRLARVTRGR